MNAYAATPEAYPALVLNADFRPLSYYPLSLWSWQEFGQGRVPGAGKHRLRVRPVRAQPLLRDAAALRGVAQGLVKPALYPAFTRFNVFLRDRFMCQYCGDKEDLTFDHLIPRSRGGQTRWDNVVAACAPCNLSKGGRHAASRRHAAEAAALRPTVFELHRNGRLFPPNYLHDSWLDYLYWDTELEP